MGRRSCSSVKRNTRIESFFAYNGDDKLIIQWWMQRERVDMASDVSWKDLNSYMVTQKKRKYGWEVLKTRWLEKIDKDLTDYCGGEVPSRESFGWKNELAEGDKWNILQQRLLIAREHVRNLGKPGTSAQHLQHAMGTVAQVENFTLQQSQTPKQAEALVLGTPPNSSLLTASPSPTTTRTNAALLEGTQKTQDYDDDVVEIPSGSTGLTTTTPLSSQRNVFRSRRPQVPHHYEDQGATQNVCCPGNIAVVAARDGITAMVLFGNNNPKSPTQQVQCPCSPYSSQTYNNVVDPAIVSPGPPQYSTPKTTNMTHTCSPAETGMKESVHVSPVMSLTSPALDAAEIENRTASAASSFAVVMNSRMTTSETIEILDTPDTLVKNWEHVSAITSDEASRFVNDESIRGSAKESCFTLCSSDTAIGHVFSDAEPPIKCTLVAEGTGTSAQDIGTTVTPIIQHCDAKSLTKEPHGVTDYLISQQSVTRPAEVERVDAQGGSESATLATDGDHMDVEGENGKRKNDSSEIPASSQENSKKLKTNGNDSCLPVTSSIAGYSVEHEVRFPSRFASNKPGAESTDVRGYQFPVQKFSGLEFYVIRKFEDPVDACKAVGREFLIRFYGGKVLKFLHQIGRDTICIASDEQDYNEQVATLIPGNIVYSSCLEQLARYQHQCTPQDFLGFSMWPTTVSEQYVSDGENEDEEEEREEKNDGEGEEEINGEERAEEEEKNREETVKTPTEDTTPLANPSSESSQIVVQVTQEDAYVFIRNGEETSATAAVAATDNAAINSNDLKADEIRLDEFIGIEEYKKFPNGERNISDRKPVSTLTVKSLETPPACVETTIAEPANVPSIGDKHMELVRVFGIIAGIVNSDHKISYPELRSQTAESFKTRYGKDLSAQTIRHKVDRKRKCPEKLLAVLRLAEDEFNLTEEIIQKTVDYFGHTSADN